MMETYQIVLAIIIAILLGLLLLYIIPKYYKLFRSTNKDSKQNIIKSSTSILQQSDEKLDLSDNYDTPREGYVQLVLQNNDYQILKITIQSTLYQQRQVIPENKVIKSLEYEFKLDNQFNQSYRCIEKNEKEMIIYNQYKKKIYYQGNIDNAPQDKQLGFEHINGEINNLGQCYFNQLITKDELIKGSSTIIDIFAQYLNLENLKQYIRDNKNHYQIYKSSIFFPSSILNKNLDKESFIQKYKDYVFQYEPINYQLGLVYEKLFFITSYQENEEYFIIEINYSDQATIHDLRDKKKQNYNYEPYIKLLQGIIPKLNIITCAQCNLSQRKEKSNFAVCFNMLRESQNKKLQSKIQSIDKLSEHLQQLIQL